MLNGEYDWEVYYSKLTSKAYLLTESTYTESPDGTASPDTSRLGMLAANGLRRLVRLSDSVKQQPADLPKFYSKISMVLTANQIRNFISGTEIELEALARFWEFTKIDHCGVTPVAAEIQQVAYINSNAAITTGNVLSLNTVYEGGKLPEPCQYTFGEVRIHHKDGNWFALDIAESFQTESESKTGTGYVTAVISDDLSEVEKPTLNETLTISELLSGDIQTVYYCGDDSDMLTPVSATLDVYIDNDIKLTLTAIAE